ncbi:hypothetical protein [Paenibacillus typhae]|uniref:hypothetical protein n=1 Tax=Paenibacillus typhae TaxID=1174501 RepID=UPI001C8D6C58|nr:hypothetical protein [Paenibacillus typhae]MBY0014692.1 hypothetical protein [Paenibacillus typhae]
MLKKLKSIYRILFISTICLLVFPYQAFAQYVTNTYDINGRMTSSTKIENDNTSVRTFYSYDPNGNLKSKKTTTEPWRNFNVSTFPVNDNFSFEKDVNQNNLPDFWETAWRIGSSTSPSATIIKATSTDSSVDGSSLYRLNNGKGEASSYQYVLSDPIAVGGKATYRIQAYMRYLLSAGVAEMTVIQADAGNNTIQQSSRSFKSGGGKWNKNSITFDTLEKATSIRIRFAVGGEENATLDIDKVTFANVIQATSTAKAKIAFNGNSSFEKDQNNDGKPDQWDVSWRNGTSSGAFAAIVSYLPGVEGKNQYRLFSGTGDAASYMYALSEKVPVAGGATYKLSVSMLYALSQGSANMSILEFAADGSTTNEIHNVYRNGGWSWKVNSKTFTAQPNTTHIAIRFAVGGEVSAYLDIDQVQIELAGAADINDNASFETKDNTNNLPDLWTTAWRNGTSANPSAERVLIDTLGFTEGLCMYRLFGGTGTTNSYQYAHSSPIPVAASVTYTLSAAMRYTLNQGGHAEMSVIQLDKNGTNIGEAHSTASNGGWQWHNQYMDIVTLPNTTHIIIRFAVGGEASGAYLDIDDVRIINKSW